MGLNTLDSARVYAEIVSEGFSTQSNGVNTISLDQDTLFATMFLLLQAQGYIP